MVKLEEVEDEEFLSKPEEIVDDDDYTDTGTLPPMPLLSIPLTPLPPSRL
jgi:hypothetical protein